MAREVIASQLIWNCLAAKREKYINEREVRYVIMNVVAKFDRHRKLFKGKTYVEAPLPLKAPGNVMQILVGPHAPRDAEETVSDFLRAQGYPDGIPVRRSSATVQIRR
jgi:hypothetical protein